MARPFRSRVRPLLPLLVLSAALLAHAHAHAQDTSSSGYQAAPPPQSGDYRAAPPPAQAPPPSNYQAPPPSNYQAPPQGNYQAPPQGNYQVPQQGGYPQQAPAGYPPPPPNYAPPPGAYPVQAYATPYGPTQQWARPPRPKRGMMIAGASIFGGSYLLSMIIGASLLDENSHDGDCSNTDDCRAVGRLLFIPVVGPFVAMGRAHDGDGALLLLGMVETVGLGLLIGGIFRYRNSVNAMQRQGFGWELDHHRRLTLDVGTSPLMAGPRMRLDF